jgi:transposase
MGGMSSDTGDKEMIKVEEVEKIRRAYFREGMSLREIARTLHHSRRVIRRAIESADPGQYRLVAERPAPVLGPWKARIDALWQESQQMPRKQRYTARKIYQALRQEGYAGSEVTVSRYVGHKRRASQAKQVFLPLAFDPGEDAQVDRGEAVAEIAGERVGVQLFILRLNYSHARFVTPALALRFSAVQVSPSRSRSRRRFSRATSRRSVSLGPCPSGSRTTI